MDNLFDNMAIKGITESIEENITIVGIGASAGGLDAITEFFDNTPADTNLAYVVIQHLSPDHKSLMKELLSRHTKMSVTVAENEMRVIANNIYLIPPAKSMIIKNNKLYLSERVTTAGTSLPINTFFTSLAEDKKEKAIGVILSGSGSDGSGGIKAIKSNGGLVLAQDEETAQFVSMPNVALATGCVAHVLSPSKMPSKILEVLNGDIEDDFISDNLITNEEVFNKILNYIKEYTHTDFFHYKKGTILRRIEKRMSLYGIESLEQYLRYININIDEIKSLYKEFFIGVTHFFRDKEAFEIIEKEVVPSLFENKNPGATIRIWIAGCSTGEEAYSMAILLKEYMNRVDKDYNIKIFASDIDDMALAKASNGLYHSSIEEHVSCERLKNFFIKKEDKYQINKSIRDMVIFAKHNLINDPPFSKVDLVTCRNLLIYLQPETQQSILGFFHFALNENGYLFLGSSESIGNMGKHFIPYNNKWKIFKYGGIGKLNRINSFSISNIGGYVNERNSSFLNYGSPRASNYIEKSVDKIIKQLQEEYVPKGVIIDESYELVHVFGDVNRYIKIPSNKLSLNLLKMIRPDLSIAVSTSVHTVINEGKELRYKNIRIKDSDGYFEICLTVKPYVDETTSKRYVILLFEEEGIDSCLDNGEDFQVHSKVYQRISDLENELKHSNEHVQAIIEELESSNEELQSTNEELLSSNEELQSTNEELQSVNEELYTLNSEYQFKINELTEAHDDINNLLNITNVSTIFLDRNLCIRRFTSCVKREINIIDSDIGRPISHISMNLKYENMIDDIHSVVSNLKPKNKIVPGFSSDWYQVCIYPYLASESRIKGIVINIENMTAVVTRDNQIKKLSEEKEKMEARYLEEIRSLKNQLAEIGND